MPRFFLDTEFIEGFHKPLFGKKRHFIDLVSIGIVRDDGKELYMVSSDYNFFKASPWVVDNVIAPIYRQEIHGDARNHYTIDNFHKYYGAPNESIKKAILKFFGCWRDQHFWRAPEDIQVYGYYSDYDWVLFCSLFGKMIDLPKGFPMYCRDLKQSFDEAQLRTPLDLKSHCDYPIQKKCHDALSDARWDHELYNFLKAAASQKIFLRQT